MRIYPVEITSMWFLRLTKVTEVKSNTVWCDWRFRRVTAVVTYSITSKSMSTSICVLGLFPRQCMLAPWFYFVGRHVGTDVACECLDADTSKNTHHVALILSCSSSSMARSEADICKATLGVAARKVVLTSRRSTMPLSRGYALPWATKSTLKACNVVP
jgi:hypothetical protein